MPSIDVRLSRARVEVIRARHELRRLAIVADNIAPGVYLGHPAQVIGQ